MNYREICHSEGVGESYVTRDFRPELCKILFAAIDFEGEWTDELFVRLTHKFLAEKYGEQNINFEAVEINYVVVSTSIDISYFWFGNLYSFVLMNGVCIPYTQWVYDRIFYTRDFAFKYSEGDGRGKIERLPPVVPQEAKDRIAIQQGHIKLLEQQLQKLEPLRKKSEAIGNIIASLQAPMQTVLSQLVVKNKNVFGEEIGDVCNRDGCTGTIRVGTFDSSCQCFLLSNPPCSHCTTTSCTTCDYVHGA